MRRTVLFVCTGNYYRSRFAEHLFTHRATQARLAWRADSAGLSPSPAVNVGAVSPLVIAALAARGAAPVRRHRLPRRLTDAELGAAAVIVVLDGRQHRAAFRRAHPAHLARVEWWDVPDLHEMPAVEALERVAARVDDLVERLRLAAAPVRIRSPRRPGALPAVRDAVRVVLLDPADRVLLLRYAATDDGGWVWAPPGGGLEPGEDHLAAARRELTEELTDAPDDEIEMGPWIGVREARLDLPTGPVRQRERWYVARARTALAPDDARRRLLAAEGVHETRWWTAEELAAEHPRTAPAGLAELLPDLVAGRFPTRPVDLGI